MIDIGLTQNEIAACIGCNQSTISRELKRNRADSDPSRYDPVKAQKRYEKCRRKSRRKSKLEDPELAKKVSRSLREKRHSPEQIEIELKRESRKDLKVKCVCAGTIYRAIRTGLVDRVAPGEDGRPAKYSLPRGGKGRRTRSETRGRIKVGGTIHERPPQIEDGNEFGHWEIDTVAGVRKGCRLLTPVERFSRFTRILLLPDKTADSVFEAMKTHLKDTPIKSITSDRGKEFARWSDIEDELGVVFHFADPHSPWQRGTNENANGRLREFFPKRKPIPNDPEEIPRVEAIMNDTVRKCLGGRACREVYEEEKDKMRSLPTA